MRQSTSKKKYWWAMGIGVLLLGGYTVFRVLNPSSSALASPLPPGTGVTVYRSATCGCCGNYISYLKQKGAEVAVTIENDISQIQNKLGVPANLRSCHTSVIGDKIIEGHMPVEVIAKFLKDQPNLQGIALPGMPSGSPGMPGPKLGAFDVYGFTSATAVEPYLSL